MVLFALMLVACGPKKMEPIALNKDQCDFCKMSIADGKYGAELITEKGRIYKFDDLHCMIGFKNENSTNKVQNFFIHNYTRNNQLIPAETAFYIQGGELVSPMNGNIAAFATELEADQYAKKMKAQKISWASIVN
jgi:copper chaperone NosL